MLAASDFSMGWLFPGAMDWVLAHGEPDGGLFLLFLFAPVLAFCYVLLVAAVVRRFVVKRFAWVVGRWRTTRLLP